MRLFVFSDTHLPSRTKSLPKIIYSELGQADFVIHAGDFTDEAVVEALEQTVPFAGVAGSCPFSFLNSHRPSFTASPPPVACP